MASTSRADEGPIIRRLLQRDDPDDWLEAWHELVDRHGGRVYGLALRMLRNREDAEDAAQDVWQRALGGLRQFRGDSALATWLFRITMNVCSSRLAGRPPTAQWDGGAAEMPDPAPDPERRAVGREMFEAVERALGTLDPAFRSTLILREIEGLRYEEIAEVLDIPVNTVKTRLHRARRELQAALAEFRP